MRKKLPMKISGQALLQAMGEKLNKFWYEVTADDIHNFGHTRTQMRNGEEGLALFHKQVDLKTAQMLVENPQKIFESY